jgi:Domain of unknown function (DUF4114)
MMNRKALLIAALALLCFAAAPAMAAMTYGDGGVALQGVLDDITISPVFGDSSADVVNDPIAEGYDDMWRVTGLGASAATMIIELASFAGTNTLGVYDFHDTSKKVELFGGSAVGGTQAFLSIKADGSVWVDNVDSGVDFGGVWFGYYMDSSAEADGGMWYSDTTKNADGLDHMAAIQGTNTDYVQLPGLMPGLWTNNEYVLAWEDLAGPNADRDFTDMVLMVESVMVPVPGAILLGVLGLGAAGMKLRRRNA